MLPVVAVCAVTAGELGAATVAGTVALVPAPPTAVSDAYAPTTRSPVVPPDAPRAIVYLERADGVYPPAAAPAVAVVAQSGYQFRPAMIAVRRGSEVSFPNRDDEFHNVFSYSPAKRFDLGRFRKDEESPRVAFEKAGLVKVYCEIHEHMRSLVLVLDTPWFTTTDETGRFALADVPPGEYLILALLASEETVEERLTVTAEGAADVALGR